MEATPQDPTVTLDDDLSGEISSFRQRARETIDQRRNRLIELQQGIAEEARSIASKFDRERSLLDSERQTVNSERQHIEEQLERLESLRNEISQDRTQWDQQQSGVIERQEKLLHDLTEQHNLLEGVRKELDQREAAFNEQQVRFEHDQSTLFSLQIQQAERDEQLDRAEKELAAAREELETRERELASGTRELESRRTELETLQSELDERRRELDALEKKAEQQRKQIAARLRQQKAEGLAEIERRKAEVAEINSADDGQLRRELELIQQQCQTLREDISNREARAEELTGRIAKLEEQLAAEQKRSEEAGAARDKAQLENDKLRKQLEETNRQHGIIESKLEDRLTQLNDLKSEIEQLREASKSEANELANTRSELERARGQAEVLEKQQQDTKAALQAKEEEIARLQQELRTSDRGQVDSDATRMELQRVTQERDQLQRRVDDLANQPAGGASSEDADELRQRYDVAVADIRELKQTNRELEEKLKKARDSGSAPLDTSSSDGMDWESQKRKLLAALDEEGGEDDISDDRQKERLKIEEVIKRTDRLIAEKEREIEELQQLLEQQSGNIGDMAVGAGAIAQMIDADELIQEERKNLEQLQTQWREKLREAELEVSVERAKMARERTELDEKIRQFENERSKLERVLEEASTDPSKKPNKRKWMERLGLKGEE